MKRLAACCVAVSLAAPVQADARHGRKLRQRQITAAEMEDWHRSRDNWQHVRRWRHYRVRVKRRRQALQWRYAYEHLSPADRAWARATGSCESGNRATTNTGNGFSGAFQFTMPTARAAGFKRPPHTTSWFEQAVRAVRWRNVAGRGQWPVCGR